MLEIKRLQLARLEVNGKQWPVHGFVVTHPGGALLVDTGVGGPDEMLSDWRVINRTVADALGDIDMSPADIDLVINTHLHFDHCGQNAIFAHAPCCVQRAEVERAKVESRDLFDWFGFMNARFELLDGDADIVPGVRVIATPGHTSGHQSVLVNGAAGAAGDVDVLIGDAAYTTVQYGGPDDASLPPGQAADPTAWRASLQRIRSSDPTRVHFCHDSAVIHSCGLQARGRCADDRDGPGRGSRRTVANDGCVTLLHEVATRTLSLSRLEPVIGQRRYDRLVSAGDLMKNRLAERTIWNINSTAVGGGVAEMLQVIVGYVAGIGIPIRWLTIGGDPVFFGITKRLHNQIHGMDDGTALVSSADAHHYEQVLAANAEELLTWVRPGDVAILHDPQTAGLTEALIRAGLKVIWRCHIGIDQQNDIS